MLSSTISSKLLKYQITHTESLINVINTNVTVLDASDTGTGKTYCAVAACKQLGYTPIIVCPKAVMYNWKNVCETFELEYECIVNYETLRVGKSYIKGTYKRIKSPYIKITSIKDTEGFFGEKIRYVWKIPKKCIFIFDEVHKCCDTGTLNALLLMSAKLTGRPMMILSATIADHPEKFKLFFYILNFIDANTSTTLSFDKYMKVIERWIFRNQKPMLAIHTMLYPARAARMRINVLGNLFPDTQIDALQYSMGK
jgi:superfamily II DNA or RNA helicase